MDDLAMAGADQVRSLAGKQLQRIHVLLQVPNAGGGVAQNRVSTKNDTPLVKVERQVVVLVSGRV